jgi:phospholipase/carboxylesterase
MTSFSLNTTIIPPASNNNPKQIIVLCHGYGGDGKDISGLANNWQRFLPNSIFLCPDAPEICSVNPQGYQWFDLTNEDEKIILEKSITAEEKLSLFLDEVSNFYQVELKNLSLVGFSQGCMMAIQVGLKKKQKINSILGYSGKVINQEHLSKHIYSKPNIFLMHGANDVIVPPTHLLEAKEYLKNNGIKSKIKIFENCEHKISIEGSSLGLEFLKKNLLEVKKI